MWCSGFAWARQHPSLAQLGQKPGWLSSPAQTKNTLWLTWWFAKIRQRYRSKQRSIKNKHLGCKSRVLLSLRNQPKRAPALSFAFCSTPAGSVWSTWEHGELASLFEEFPQQRWVLTNFHMSFWGTQVSPCGKDKSKGHTFLRSFVSGFGE